GKYYAVTQFDLGIKYAAAALQAIDTGQYEAVPFDLASEIGVAYLINGEPERWITQCRNMISENPGPHILPRVHLAMTLMLTGAQDEALTASEDLRHADLVTDNPALICWGLIAYGTIRFDKDPIIAFETHQLGVKIARESGNRLLES